MARRTFRMTPGEARIVSDCLAQSRSGPRLELAFLIRALADSSEADPRPYFQLNLIVTNGKD